VLAAEAHHMGRTGMDNKFKFISYWSAFLFSPLFSGKMKEGRRIPRKNAGMEKVRAAHELFTGL
jgi:hypothetical protein